MRFWAARVAGDSEGMPGQERAGEGASNLCIKSSQPTVTSRPHMHEGDSQDSNTGRLKKAEWRFQLLLTAGKGAGSLNPAKLQGPGNILNENPERSLEVKTVF